MTEFRLRCEYCDGTGYVETPDPDFQERCRVCQGTGSDPETHEKMLGILYRRTYVSYADSDPYWSMLSSRTQALLEQGLPLSAADYEWREVRRDPLTGRVSCSCPAFRYSLSRQCKHVLFPAWLSRFRVAENGFVIPAPGGSLRVQFEPDRHAPVWHYRVYVEPRTYWNGAMPDWLYRSALRIHPAAVRNGHSTTFDHIRR
jgi:hypothetical protein